MPERAELTSLEGKNPQAKDSGDNINLGLCGSRKYPYPHHGGNWKFQRGGGGGGGSKALEIPERRGGC